VPGASVAVARDGVVISPYIDSSYKWAGGGFLDSAEDLVRFGSAHLQPGCLRRETLDQPLARPCAARASRSIGKKIVATRVGL
jgi:hypothetical protein